MLVLSRKLGERIVIDGGIQIIITKIKGTQVSLGFIAPDSVKISRGELMDETKGADGANQQGQPLPQAPVSQPRPDA